MINKPVQLAVFLKQAYTGRYEDRLELVFRDDQLQKNFIITRPLKAIVANQAEHEAFRPRAPYVPRTRFTRPEIREVVEGVRPPALEAIRYVTRLPRADIPNQLRTMLGSTQSRRNIQKNVSEIFMPKVFNSATYSRHFKHLLWIEEAKMEYVHLNFVCGVHLI